MFPRETVARAAFFSVLSIAGLTPGAASACNFLENLFGGCRAPAPVYAPAQEAPASERKKHVGPRVARNPEAYKQKTLAAPEGQKSGSLAHFEADSTLRRGDVVVTPEGFRVFTGRSDERLPEDFAPLGRKQGELSTLEQASQRGAGAWAKSPVLRTAPAEGEKTAN